MSSRVAVHRNVSEAQPMAWREAGDSYAPRTLAERTSGATPAADAAGGHAGEESLREAHQTGFREGEAAGRSAAQAELRPVLERLGSTIEELARLRPQLREQAERDLIRLAVAIARRILRRELTVDPEAIAGLVKAALDQLATEERVCVKVHPEHEAAVRACLANAGRSSAIEIATDPALERGSAIFETARGDLDASAEAQLAEIERGLTDRCGGKN